jgi:hypothetical protein
MKEILNEQFSNEFKELTGDTKKINFISEKDT